MTRHFPFSTELWHHNQIAFAEILLWLACSPQTIPLTVFHLILTDENPFSVATLAAFHFNPTTLQVVLWCYWLGLRVLWSEQPHTGLLAALLLLHSVTLHQHCAYNVIIAVGIGSRRASKCKHITMRHKRVLS